MEENNYKPQIPDVMEAIFDAAYLIFDLVAAILFFTFSKGNILFVLYGILTLPLYLLIASTHCPYNSWHQMKSIPSAKCQC